MKKTSKLPPISRNDAIPTWTRGLTLALALTGLPASASPPGQPSVLRVNDVSNPVGTWTAPSFGWRVHDPDSNEIQTRYQILVASSAAKLAADVGDVWDSGEVAGRLQNHVAFGGGALESDRKYHWKVRTWDKDGNSGPYSEPASFVVGPTANANWEGAKWIRRDNKDADDYTYFRKQAQLPAKTVERATVYISGTHKYELHLNGSLVGKGPAYHHPQFQYYNAWDVTPLVKAGAANQFAILNHWFGGGQGRPAGDRGVIMKAVVHFTDGTSTTIATDGTWKQSRAEQWVAGQKARNRGEGVGYVERIDGRLWTPDWNSLSFDDSKWAAATEIGPHPTPPWTGTLAPDLTRIEETVIAPASVKILGAGKYVVDLGKVYSGNPRIRFSGGAAGTLVEMRGGYALDSSGEIDPKRNQGTDMSYQAVLSGGSFVYEPVEYLGMRYFEIDNPPMPVTAENFSFVVRHSRMDTGASSFDSPDATLNGVWELMKHSLLTCAQEEFVDTPTREKGGFLGDGAIQSTVAMPVTHERALTRRALGEFLQSMDQHWSDGDKRGRMNAVYPNKDGARDIPDFTQAYLTWVWSYYMETGDKEFLAANHAKFRDIADYVHRATDSGTGLVTRLPGGSNQYQYGIVDWPPSMRSGYDMTAARTVINGWALADYTVVANIAEVLGNTADHDRYRAMADTLKDSINRRLINSDGVYVDGLSETGTASTHVSQHANMFPLALGIVPPQHSAAVAAKVKELRMSVGMVTVAWLVRALGEAGEGQHLIDLYTRAEWPGWARCLSRGATATWESWFADEIGDSESHAWGAAGLEGYYRYILGVTPVKPQYEEVRIRPLDFGDKLPWAKGTVATDRGPISVHWERKPDDYTLRLTLPANVTASVCIPKGSAANSSVLLDGVPVQSTVDGGYLRIDHVGSGDHTIIRTGNRPQLD